MKLTIIVLLAWFLHVASPSNTGVLIDDVKIAPAEPQEITAIEVVPFTLPVLVGADAGPLLKLKITTTGTRDPVSITGIAVSLASESSKANIKQLQPYYSSNESDFRWDTPFGKPRTPQQGNVHQFHGEQPLVEGDNFVWIACQLKDHADIDKTVSAKFESVTFSNGETKTIDGEASVQRMGIALRDAGDEGVHTYRIPGLATTRKGTLIGVYDVRRDKGGDLPGNIDVGMSRSTDGGRTWEPMQIIMDMGSDPKWNGDGIGDPSVLVDQGTGTIWVSATWSHGNRSWNGSGPGLEPEETGQWMMVKSDDDGVTWSAPTNITRQVKKTEWSFLLPAPGKGITMSDGTIVFPAQFQDPPNNDDSEAHRLPHSTFIYSRDHGCTWQIGTAVCDDTTESQVVELSDGEIMINCRNNRASQRAIMTTTDMGATWQQHSTHSKDLIEPGSCMASLINVGRELGWRGLPGADKDFLLFSNPDSLQGRNHMTIKASQDAGKSWPSAHHLLLDEQGGFGYSCLSMIDAETAGILYEGSQAQMTFQRIKLADILNPPAHQKTKNPALAVDADKTTDRVAAADREKPASELLQFARPFSHHMVLQADQPIRIWGSASPGKEVTVTFAESRMVNSTTADAQGNWFAELPAQPANKGPQTLIASTDENTVSINDVLIGEVWICAGQSNMEWELRKSTGGKEAIANIDDPHLRLLNCAAGATGNSGSYTEEHLQRLWPESFSEGQWQVASANSSASFSAVGYYFARRLRDELDVPVGIINVSVGGTPIESWVSADRLNTRPELAKLYSGNWLESPLLDDWCRQRAEENLKNAIAVGLEIPADEFGPNHSFKPGFMHEAGIAPFAPLSIRGGLWYQGESNGDNLARTKIYDACFPLLIEDWRASFRNENLPVVFVQLPAMGRANWPVFREYQRRSLSKLKNVGMAITIDTGHPTNVHPHDKQPVGNRLAQWALVKTYGKPGIPMGPLYQSKSVRENTLILTFDHAGSQLTTSDGSPPLHFEVAGTDGVYHAANAVIHGDQIHLSSEHVTDPVHARYAWLAFPDPFPNLYNPAGLPASPFSTEENLPER